VIKIRGRELFSFIRLFGKHARWMAGGAILGLVAILAAVGLLALSGWFIAATALAGLTAGGGRLFNFFLPSIGVRLLAVVRTLARYAERLVSHDATFRILESLRVWFYRHLEPLAPACLMRYRSGDVLSRIVGDIDALDHLYLRVLSPFAVALAATGLIVAGLGRVEAGIARITAIGLLTGGLILPFFAQKWGADSGRRLTGTASELRTRIVESLQGMAELLIFGTRAQQLTALERGHDQLERLQARMSHLTGLTSALLTLISGLCLTATAALGVEAVRSGRLSAEMLALSLLTVLASFETVWSLPSAFQYLGQSRESARRLAEMVASQPAVTFVAQSDVRPQAFDIRFEAVSFRYRPADPPALQDVSLHVTQGQHLALLGASGAGKSTLAHLLVRFWDPDQGRIRIGDQDIRTLAEADLRQMVVLVSQQAHMFNASIRENLILARPDARDADLMAALRAARLEELLTQLPQGLDTWIGEAGKRLSGGQIRRLAVARAILRDAPIWVLDEPTEGLDPETEAELMQTLLELCTGRTLILITHRPVDLWPMDRILHLAEGRIFEQGVTPGANDPVFEGLFK
jgi:ATP-binding cassette subfamily C protein CydC